MADARNRSLVLLVVSLLLVITVVPIAIENDRTPSPLYATIEDVDSFGNFVLDITADDMSKNGFEYGEYVLLQINGVVSKAIYLKETVCCLPYELGIFGAGQNHLKVFVFNAELSYYSPLHIGDVTLITYDSTSTRMNDYPHLLAGRLKTPLEGQSTEDFCNFRCIDLNGYKIYRGISPIYSGHSTEKQHAADQMYSKYNITYDINMGATVEGLHSDIESFRGKGIADNYVSMYDSGQVKSCYCHSDTITYADDIRKIMLEILDNSDETMCVHCDVGKDRTGTLFILLEGVAGWDQESIRNDFTESFAQLYGIDKNSREYELLKHDYFGHVVYMMGHPELLPYVYSVDWDKVTYRPIDFHSLAKNYLNNVVGMTDDEYQRLENLIGNNRLYN